MTKIYFEDVIAPSATGVVTYTASSLTSNCRYTCRLKSIGEGSESPAYDEITFTTADGSESNELVCKFEPFLFILAPSPPPRPEIEARLLKGVPFVLKLYPAFGIVRLIHAQTHIHAIFLALSHTSPATLLAI